MKCIVYTHPSGRVRVRHPDPTCMRGLCNGGGLIFAEHERYEIDKLISQGFDQGIARRWTKARLMGGCTTAEARGLIRDYNAKDFIAPELFGVAELPDSWFREAWTRSRDGGPITLDFERAKEVQAGKIWNSHIDFKAEAEKEGAINLMAGRNYFVEVPELDTAAWRKQIVAAHSIAELRAVWPRWLQ